MGTTVEALGAQEAQQQPLPPGRLEAAGEQPLPLGGERRPGLFQAPGFPRASLRASAPPPRFSAAWPTRGVGALWEGQGGQAWAGS